MSSAVVWVARAAWLALAVVGGSAVGDALDGRSRAVQVVGTAAAWVGFGAGAAALAVAGVITLTLARTVVPGSLVVAAFALAGGAGAGPVLSLVVPAVAATGAVATAELGRVYLQASAYGDEERFGLRPPVGYLLASAVTWLVAVTAVVAAPLAWAARAWLVAAVATAVAALAAAALPRRWHQLSRRWLVLVPAGVVVHDPVVLADTLMLRSGAIDSIGLDGDGTARHRAADLTGPAPGVGVEVRLAEAASAVFAARPSAPTGTAIHLTALVVAPTRPGSFLRSAAARGLPVG